MFTPLNQVQNPTDEQRHEMLMTALESVGRPEDYDYIINLLSPPPDITEYGPPGSLRGVKVGILGGGLAGMSAAYELRKLGADITVLEASADRIGGRVYTYYFDPEGTYYGEFGAMRIPVSHETTWHYINLFGLETRSMSSPRRNNFIYAHNTRLRTTDSIEDNLYPKYDLTPQERNTPWDELHSYAMEYPMYQLPPNIRAELLQILPSYSPEYVSIATRSLRQSFEAMGLSQGAINLISAVDPFNGSLLHISYDEIANELYSMDFRNIYRIEGGNVNLPYAFYRSLMSENPTGYSEIPPALLGPVTLKFGQFVTGIYQSSYRNKVVIKYRDTADGKESAEIFDYIICTIPFSSLRNVEIKPFFSNMKMQSIKEFNYMDSLKALLLCNRRFWEKDTEYGNMVGGISYTDLPINSIVYPSDHNQCLPAGTCSPNEPGVLTIYNLALDSVRLGGQREPRSFEIIRQNVEEVHGLPRGYLNTVIEQYKAVQWNSEPNFVGAFAVALPGEKIRFLYEMQQPEYHNHVFFAGEHISVKHAWMQGALYTGKAAANSLASYVNLNNNLN